MRHLGGVVPDLLELIRMPLSELEATIPLFEELVARGNARTGEGAAFTFLLDFMKVVMHEVRMRLHLRLARDYLCIENGIATENQADNVLKAFFRTKIKFYCFGPIRTIFCTLRKNHRGTVPHGGYCTSILL